MNRYLLARFLVRWCGALPFVTALSLYTTTGQFWIVLGLLIFSMAVDVFAEEIR